MMKYIPNIIFLFLVAGGIWFFIINIKKIVRNIKLGKQANCTNHHKERWKTMLYIAFGQKKMGVRPVPAVLHTFVYIGFILINVEVVEIFIDGLFGTHRFLSILGKFYNLMIGFFEILAFLVTISCVIFWCRRNIVGVSRFRKPEMNGWPSEDASYILYLEIILMIMFFVMNGSDLALQQANFSNYHHVGLFPISSWLITPIINKFNDVTFIHIVERFAWWFHILGILFFLNYLYYSKHLHIILAFPNIWYSKLEPKGALNNLESVTNEIKMILKPSESLSMVYHNEKVELETFGARDIFDLNQVQLLNAYSCTECGRCSSECPANITGKKLSPRKVMMDIRSRLEEVSINIDNNGSYIDDKKSLLGDYITPEELWACTSCNACVEACPVNIDPLSIIIDLRRYLVMEQSSAPLELNMMMSNIENNGTPWKFNNADRLNWLNN